MRSVPQKVDYQHFKEAMLLLTFWMRSTIEGMFWKEIMVCNASIMAICAKREEMADMLYIVSLESVQS